MAKVHRSALVMHSANEMFDVVSDVAAYTQFLPWCAGSEIVEETDEGHVACLVIQKGKFRHTFTTLNRITENSGIQIELIDGPFKHLRGGWAFVPISDKASKVVLDLDFDISGRIGTVVLRGVVKKAADTMVDAFCKRANELYGK